MISRHARLGGGVEASAGTHEAGVRALEHAALLGVELLALAAREDRIDAREQARIQGDLSAVLRQDRRDVALDGLQLGVRMRAR